MTGNPLVLNNFMQMHRNLLDCYGQNLNVAEYQKLNITQQRDFCYNERVRLEEQIIRGKIAPSDFFKVLQN